MHNIRGRNVNVCFQEALWLMKVASVESRSRNGKVKYLPEPVCITYEIPTERVLFNAKRDCNPYFHLMEALWMLAGRNDVEFVSRFNSGMTRYSDDGRKLHGAYGHRWIWHFHTNQLDAIEEELRRFPDSRRAVLSMWDPHADLPMMAGGGKDVPCNTHAYFSIRPEGLCMTVMNRSNDLVWGALGANAVHFAFLQEFLAYRLGVPVGLYHQISNNLHIYEQHWSMLEDPAFLHNEVEYEAPAVRLATRDIPHRVFDIELHRFLDNEHHSLSDYYVVPFLNNVAKHMMISWNARKDGVGDGSATLELMEDCDWKLACHQWIQRREIAKASA